jgi:hypothetical protein
MFALELHGLRPLLKEKAGFRFGSLLLLCLQLTGPVPRAGRFSIKRHERVSLMLQGADPDQVKLLINWKNGHKCANTYWKNGQKTYLCIG